MLKTVAVVVGISSYQSKLFGKLPGAAADARRVVKALVSWGIPLSRICLLTDETATKRAILKALRVWILQKASNNVRVLIFYAGHGSRVKEEGTLPCSVLLPYDVEPADRVGTGITLSELISAIARVKPQEAYLFLDACSLRIDVMENVLPDKMPDADILYTSGSQCLFCMVASGLHSAYESAQTSSGFFTKSVLTQIAKLRSQSKSCAVLAAEIEKDLEAQGLPKPECYFIGNQSSWLLSNIEMEEPEDNSYFQIYNIILRQRVLASLQDTILVHNGKPIWLYGKSGLGKTTLIQQLKDKIAHCIYCSVPSFGEKVYFDIKSQLSGEIVEQLPYLIPSGRPPTGDIENTFKYLADHLPGSLLAIDHLERLSSELVFQLVEELNSTSLDVILVSQNPPLPNLNVYPWLCPTLSIDEIKLFCSQYNFSGFSATYLQAITGGLPLELRKFLSTETGSQDGFTEATKSPKMRRSMVAVALSGGYVDEQLFREIFNLNLEDLTLLEEMGMIYFSDDHYLPHDSLIAISSELKTSVKVNTIQNYWCQQVLSTPQNLWACQMLINTFIQNDCDDDCDGDWDEPLLTALRSMVRIRNWLAVESVGKKLLEVYAEPSKSIIYIAEELIHIARYDVVDTITKSLRELNLDFENSARISLIESEREFWYGNYERSIALSENIVHQITSPYLKARADVNMGIAHFFKGEWAEAINHLSLANDHTVAEPRTLGWSRIILGTILGLRGTNITEGRYLLQSSIRLLEQIGDDVGVAIAWNNLGEMTWKLKEYRTALAYLSMGQKLAESVDDRATQLEITRNLVHVRLRLNGVYSHELEEVINRLKNFLSEIQDPTEQMQAWNTLASVAAYRGDLKSLEEMIQKAHPFTIDNCEYHIYTLANQALLEALSQHTKKSIEYLKEALNLARQGQNYLAISQIKDDINNILASRKLPSLNALYQFAESVVDQCDKVS